MKVISHLLPFSLLLLPIIWGLYGFFKTRGEAKNILTADQKNFPSIDH